MIINNYFINAYFDYIKQNARCQANDKKSISFVLMFLFFNSIYAVSLCR